MDQLYNIRRNMSNNKLRAIAPIIQATGVSYEQGHFAKKLELGKLSLRSVEEWLRPHLEMVDIDALKGGVASEYVKLIHIASVDLVETYAETNKGHNETDIIPATLHLDAIRFLGLRSSFHANVKKGIILMAVNALRMPDSIKIEVAKNLAFERYWKSDFLASAMSTIRMSADGNFSFNDVLLSKVESMLAARLVKDSDHYRAMVSTLYCFAIGIF